jgi:hypothetical protein
MSHQFVVAAMWTFCSLAFARKTMMPTWQQGRKVRIVRFEVFTAVAMKNAFFWDVTPCGCCKNWRVGGTHCIYHQGGKNPRARNDVGSNTQLSDTKCFELNKQTNKQTNSVALSPRANYTDWATTTCRRNSVPTFVDRGVSRGQRGGSPTVVNLSFLDRCFELGKQNFPG